VLPCLDNPCAIHVTDAAPDLIATLERERDQVDARISCLGRNRDAISAYLDAVRRDAVPPARPDHPRSRR
jgi:hypothetical protein